jgi:hypothetical protein
MVVEVDGAESTFGAGVPKALFEVRAELRSDFAMPAVPDAAVNASYYAASGNGQRFLVSTLVGESTPTPLTVVLNWTAAIKR